MARTIAASALRKGDTFNYSGRDYVVMGTHEIEHGVAIAIGGSAYSMEFYTDSPVELVDRPGDAPVARPALAAFAAQQVRDARAELDRLAACADGLTPADHRIEYTDGGRRRTSYYTTREGFLRALVRLYSNPARYGVDFVD